MTDMAPPNRPQSHDAAIKLGDDQHNAAASRGGALPSSTHSGDSDRDVRPVSSQPSSAATSLPSSIGLDPLAHEWVADVNADNEPVFYVRCALADGTDWLEARREAGI